MTIVFFHRLAAREYRKARDDYERARRGLGSDFVEEIRKALDRIAGNPEGWPIYEADVRWLRVKRFSYVLYYRPIAKGEVELLAVAHANRRLGYWKKRRKSVETPRANG